MRSSHSLPLRGLVPGSVRAGVKEIGNRAVVFAETLSTQRRGALARRDGETLASAANLALEMRLPLVLELATSGADVSEGVDALHGWGGAAAAVAACSGVVPILVGVTGPVVSGPALLLGLADIVVMDPKAMAFVSGPSMVAAFTGQTVSLEQLGGTAIHSFTSGLCALETSSVSDSLADLLEFLPSHCDALPPEFRSDDPIDRGLDELRELVPGRPQSSYDIRDVMSAIVDDRHLMELWSRWAPQLVTSFARLAGRPIGLIGNQPQALAGTLDIAASQKGARFVRFCDAFNLPLVTLVDTPGFLPGKDLEWRGMIRHGAELAFAYAQATVPRVCVILRKAFGGAYIVMDSKGLGNDVCLAWPGAEVAVMGSRGASQVLHRGSDPAGRRELEEQYERRYLSPWPASDRGLIDEVIDPAETRVAVSAALSALSTKRELLVGRKHDGGPL